MTTTGHPVRRRGVRTPLLPGLLVATLLCATGAAFAPGTGAAQGTVSAAGTGVGAGSESGWAVGTAAGTGSLSTTVPAVTPAAPCPGQEIPPGPPAKEETGAAVAPLPVPDPAVGGLAVCTEAHAGAVPPPPVGVASYVVADLDSGAVLAARSPHARQRPASTIKLLLAMVASDLLPPERVVVGTVEDGRVDGSRAGIGPGGRYTVDQLLHGLLMASGNDAAHALARELGGVPATLAAMQDTARHLGALDTRPATPSGLDGPGSSSSAYDLALILRAALERPQVAAILLTPSIPFPGFADRPGFELGNDDQLLGTPGFLGGKNGFTDAARHTFVGALERDGRRLVVALVRGEPRPVRMVDQARALLDWGFGAPAAGIGTLVEPGSVTGPQAAMGAGPAGPGSNGSGGSGSGDLGRSDPGRSERAAGGAGALDDPASPSGVVPPAPDAGVPAAAVVGGVAVVVGLVALLVARLRWRRR
ncbi:D-alanyl-D-alanine carboxypeptidase family protein [Pseudonocardia parietis]|uniref:D-alanyl-D-alanine carboxypeptidase (Penicillin-binding protein 5/6) n=1 Tax=Pseudonocardia parietis TaxID=570936 RepID=A0ABS4VQB0_9PSEU|nr:serine hydrolase [Pseudonocardia parietis]MBP2365933.1 D-alanyl-D-alanine carboxypeptidase (penicillin-binding protein 5/6) [Pseudonocardia parietis]